MTQPAVSAPGGSWPDVVADALAAPAGARWHRVALQVNPYDYHGRSAPSTKFPDERSYNEAIVRACRQGSIELIAITDHWRVRTAEGLARAADDAGIVVLPGFEAVSSEGIHLLVLFERGTGYDEVDAAIGACGGTPACAPGNVGNNYAEIVRCVVGRRALVIPAHVNGPNGLFTVLQGQALKRAWCNEDVHAVAVSPGQALTPLHERILENKEQEYRRPHPVARLHADDINDPARLGTQGGTCWVKMSTPSLTALDLATRTRETRIMLVDPALSPHPAIETISWEGGFLDGVRMRLSDSLTCLVGGRGTGKSTIIESIRYALGVGPIGDAADRHHRGLVDNVLVAGTKISMLVRCGAGEFVVERSVPDPPVVRDASGTALASRPTDVLGPVEVFSQHELAELADSRDYIARLLQRIFGDATEPASNLPIRLRRNREAIVAGRQQLDEIDDALDDLPRLQEALTHFHSAHLDERLNERTRIERERRVLDTAAGRVDDVLATAAPLRDEGLLDQVFTSSAALQELPNAAILARISDVLGALHAEVTAAADAIDRAVATARAALSSIEAEWSAATAPVREQYDAVLRSLQESGLDASRYLATQRALEQLAPLADQRRQIAARISALYDERRQLLADLNDHASAERRKLGDACRAANDALHKTVRVRPLPSTDRRELLTLIDNAVSGQRAQIKSAVQQENFSPKALADACRAGPEQLAGFGIRGAQAANLVAAGEELFLRLEEMAVGRAALAELNVGSAAEPDFRGLDDLSKGQKATALLLLLLATLPGPLIVDQPEDDLDNRFIWEGVVPRVRADKGIRQLVFSTHNANIPVLGDAELMVVLESAAGKGRVTEGGAGSLDDHTVLALAGEILEGGPDAFERRRYLYGF
ncbi:MAG: TrlF family AAA-like ATPase [Solirubrobacteraceae bacterium]